MVRRRARAGTKTTMTMPPSPWSQSSSRPWTTFGPSRGEGSRRGGWVNWGERLERQGRGDKEVRQTVMGGRRGGILLVGAAGCSCAGGRGCDWPHRPRVLFLHYLFSSVAPALHMPVRTSTTVTSSHLPFACLQSPDKKMKKKRQAVSLICYLLM